MNTITPPAPKLSLALATQLLLMAATLLTTFSSIGATFSDEDWVSMGGIPGADDRIIAIVADSAGSVYVGGGFTVVGDTIASRIAKWDGTKWTALGSGLNGSVHGLAFDHEGNLYAGGDFTIAGGVSANRIAKWDGSNWSALSSGVNSSITALAFDDAGNLYAGGSFTTAGGVTANRIAKWNGSNWSALGSGMDSRVLALAFDSSGNLYAGGEFTITGGTSVGGIAKWDGSNWSALGSGMNSSVKALAFDTAGNLYAGGNFNQAGGIAANFIAKWDGSNWSAVGSGMASNIFALAFDNAGMLYAGGNFGGAGGVTANRIAKWNGTNWSALGTGMNDTVVALAIDDAGKLFAGGNFTLAGGVGVKAIAKWDETRWSALGSGINAQVNALAIDSADNVYAGGLFTAAGGVNANLVAKWDGSNWSPLGSGMNDAPSTHISASHIVFALTVDSAGNLYAGGSFKYAGSVTANGIAKWDGSNWSALGRGVDQVYALAIDSAGNLYAGGNFTTAGGVSASHIAKWDGSNWSPLGLGLNGVVYALAIDHEGNLYAGGGFTTAGGVSANGIAKWDGSNWSALGSGMNTPATALEVDSAGNLYANVEFTMVGGVYARGPAKWDGNNWSALGSGIVGRVSEFAVDSAGNLYAGGSFTEAGGVSANRIAKWDGSSWSALGSGVNLVSFKVSFGAGGGAAALALDRNGNLYAGGGFSIAGGKVSGFAAYAKLPAPTPRDLTPPTITLSGPSAAITSAGPISYTVTYSDDNFDQSTLTPANVVLNATGTATGTVTITGAGTVRTVTSSGITGDGALGISIASGTATDASGNPAPSAGPSATFSVDNTAPVIRISPPSNGFATTGPVTYTVTYADANFGGSNLAAANLVLNRTGTANGILSVAGSGITYSVTISSITGTGTLGISISPGTATDLAGNAAAGAISATFSVENTPPNTKPLVTASRSMVAADEGGTATNSGTWSDVDGDDVTLTASRGTVIKRNSTWTWQFAAEDGPLDSNVNVTANDGHGGTSTTSFKLLVNNVAPSVTIFSPAAGLVQAVNSPINFSGTFTDPGAKDTHTANWSFSAASVADHVEAATVSGSTIADTFQFAEPGVYLIKLTVTDNDGASGIASAVNNGSPAYVVIFDPKGGDVTGGGWIESAPGSFASNPSAKGKANFGFNAKYNGANNTVPQGNLEFDFKEGGINFKSTSLYWLVVSENRAQFKGSGTINRKGDFGFIVTLVDGNLPGGDGEDRLRLQILDRSVGVIVYDNQPGAGINSALDERTMIGKGNVVVHKH